MRYLTIIFILISFSSFCQLKQRMADKAFEHMDYSQSAAMYKELVNSKVKHGKPADMNDARKAAISYYNQFDMKSAIHFYDFLNKHNGLQENDGVNYVEALRFLGKYKEANVLNETLLKRFPNNKYFQSIVATASELNNFLKDSIYTRIKKTDISSIYGDFAPSYYGNTIVYATKSVNAEPLRGRYGWDNSFYVSLLQTDLGKDSTLKNGKLLHHQFLDRAHDGPVVFTRDGQRMVITKNKLGKKKGKDAVSLALYFSEKVDGKWGKLTPFAYNDDNYNVGHGCFSDDGKTLYFVSDMKGGYGKTDLYSSRLENGTWSKPVNLGDIINSDQKEMFPFVVGTKLFFASEGHPGLGGLDIFMVDLENISTPKNLGYPINSSADDFGLIGDSSFHQGYFSSNRGDHIDKIYEFVHRDIRPEVEVQVYKRTSEGDSLQINFPFEITSNSIDSSTYFTENDGSKKVALQKDKIYRVKTNLQYYLLKQEETVSTENLSHDSIFQVKLYLIPTQIHVSIRVLDSTTKKPLVNAEVAISGSKKPTLNLLTDSLGMVSMTAERLQKYNAYASKKGYLDGQKDFMSSLEGGDVIELELALPPIKKGDKFVLDNIYYDFDKATLRPESKASLDKLAAFLLKNNLKIELSSHTDSRGSNAYNQRLSQARAQSCVDYLITKGVPKNSITAKGYGESQLLNGCKDGVPCTEEEHQKNRRTEIKILEVDNQ